MTSLFLHTLKVFMTTAQVRDHKTLTQKIMSCELLDKFSSQYFSLHLKKVMTCLRIEFKPLGPKVLELDIEYGSDPSNR